jgi:CTP:molybdopterin cytidylyltransferase MocA
MAIKAGNSHSSQVPATWDTLSQEMGDGGNMDYDMFAARWEAEDQIQDPKAKILHNLVSNFDENQVIIKVHGDQPKVQNQTAGKSVLDTTAERGAQNTDMA